MESKRLQNGIALAPHGRREVASKNDGASAAGRSKVAYAAGLVPFVSVNEQ